MKTKYEGCCSLTKQIEITLDLLTNDFKSSNSILQLRGNFKISMMIAYMSDGRQLPSCVMQRFFF